MAASSSMAELDERPAGPVPTKLVPWVEKYRPRRVDDVSHQEEVVATLKRAITTGNLPHLLFYGPPGTGKTSTINALAAELYGARVGERKLELNASDERGIDVVRDKIKRFAEQTVSSGGSGPTFKLIILDEADSLTPDAQTALRRTMEVTSRVTRFCIICNYVSRIIEPLISRCAVFRFKPLAAPAMRARLEHIAGAESLRLSSETVDALLAISHGDMRKAITTMQSGAALYGSDLLAEHVIEAAGELPDRLADKLLTSVRSTSFKEVSTAARDVSVSGFAMSAVVDKLFDAVVEMPDVSEAARAGMIERLARASRSIAEGCDESVAILDLLLGMQRSMHEWVVPCDSEIEEL